VGLVPKKFVPTCMKKSVGPELGCGSVDAERRDENPSSLTAEVKPNSLINHIVFSLASLVFIGCCRREWCIALFYGLVARC
jgi:hypothetical protein